MLLLIQLIIDARLVVLPEPVGPVTRIRPRGRWINCSMTGGRPSCSKVRNSLGIRRSTSPMLPRCLKMATRNRAMSPNAKPKSRPADLLQFLLAPLGRDALHQGRRVRRLEDLGRQRPHVAVEPEHRLAAHGQVQVARLLRADRLEQLVDQQRAHCPGHPSAGTSMEPETIGPTETAVGRGLDFCPDNQVSTES